jgi:hypothetical protein
MDRGPKAKSETGHVEWPSLDEQLAASKVVPDSALEKLIRANQDFGVLDPAEAHDQWRLPPWLRVHFRKQHPEIKPKRPGTAYPYPLALMNIYAWMLANQDLPERLPRRRSAK